MPNILKTGSIDSSAEGVIKTIEIQTPAAQVSEMSDEDFRFHILYTRGILKRGIIIPATIPVNLSTVVKSIEPHKIMKTDYYRDKC